jgi:Transcriptional regulatory protein, C terminal/FHA domain
MPTQATKMKTGEFQGGLLMEERWPFVLITSPGGDQFRAELTTDRVTIGRSDLFNDIALEPDPQQLVTRKVHCVLEREADGWWVTHNGGVNPTYVRRGSAVEIVEGRTRLQEGDHIHLLGSLTETGDLRYWELTLHDPLRTQPVKHAPRLIFLEYDWIQARLFRVDGVERQEFRDLPPQEHKLVRYMARCNQANGEVTVCCPFEDLLVAVWGEASERTETDLTSLIYHLRKRLEPDPRTPRLIETVRGLGYRLVKRPFTR